jgi:hypothetical protein
MHPYPRGLFCVEVASGTNKYLPQKLQKNKLDCYFKNAIESYYQFCGFTNLIKKNPEKFSGY